MVSSKALPGLERVPGDQNWIDRLPKTLKAAWHKSWIYRSAKHRVANGLTISHAIASSVEDCHKGTVGGHPVKNPKTIAEQKAALVVWAAMKKATKAKKATKG